MDDPAEVITIYKAANSAEAFLVCNALQSEGIQCQVAEANEPLAGLTITEPDILIHRGDQARAEAIIAAYEEQRRRDINEDTDIDDEDDEFDDIKAEDWDEGAEP
jgi:hypothetical protein